MERYLGHTCGDRVQTVKEHLEGTAVLSGEFASRFGKRDWGYCCGLLHDIGKYSAAFQKKITENSDRRVDHSSAGMQVCFEKGGMYGFMGYCIAGHHAGLPNYGAPTDDAGSSSLCGRRKRKLEDYQAYRNEIKIPELASVPFDVKKAHDPDFSMSVFIRMLYSCLVDADFLDTETFMKEGETGRIPGDSLEVLLERLETYISDWLESNEEETVNGRRTEILRHCLESGSIDRGLFRLTVPTGGGKTISSLAFALRHAVKHGMDRVIYVIPYTNENVLIRIRAEQGNVTWGRAEIIKAYLIQNYHWKEGENFMALNTESCDTAYVLGRLFAVLESIQMDTNPGIRSTIRDRYFNSASTAPASVFPILNRLKNSHLKKLEREKGSSKIFYERLLTELMGKLEHFPLRLSLEEQGEFALGYYHQMQKRYEKKEEK